MAEVIGQNLKNGASLKDHAVLYRMNAQSNPIETYFARAGIPYRIVGGQRFFDRKEVKDINSYMAVVVNPRDDVRLRRIINEPARKIGATTIDKIGGTGRRQRRADDGDHPGGFFLSRTGPCRQRAERVLLHVP